MRPDCATPSKALESPRNAWRRRTVPPTDQMDTRHASWTVLDFLATKHGRNFRCQREEFRCQEFRCESIFSRGGATTPTMRLTDDAEAMGNDLDPVLCTVGPATAPRRPHAIQRR